MPGVGIAERRPGRLAVVVINEGLMSFAIHSG
jgi:hypothetical protein